MSTIDFSFCLIDVIDCRSEAIITRLTVCIAPTVILQNFALVHPCRFSISLLKVVEQEGRFATIRLVSLLANHKLLLGGRLGRSPRHSLTTSIVYHGCDLGLVHLISAKNDGLLIRISLIGLKWHGSSAGQDIEDIIPIVPSRAA